MQAYARIRVIKNNDYIFALQHDLNENERHGKINHLDKHDNIMLTNLYQFWWNWVKADKNHITLNLSTS